MNPGVCISGVEEPSSLCKETVPSRGANWAARSLEIRVNLSAGYEGAGGGTQGNADEVCSKAVVGRVEGGSRQAYFYVPFLVAAHDPIPEVEDVYPKLLHARSGRL